MDCKLNKYFKKLIIRHLPFLITYYGYLIQHILNLENIYYRWRVYSYLQGDGDKNYRQEPFQMVRNGTFWYPPQLTTNLSYPVILNIEKIVFLSEAL